MSDIEGIRRRAEGGDAVAQYEIGMMCLEGEGVPQDDAEAVRWIRLSAEAGHPPAQTRLGR
ncbi:MAG: sel1 repeat family protein, partial [Methanomassiliicoccaceae archaeon]|nr:sel1 repeat family protein [Methanomassiliicoccaceae archaeon]